MASPVLVPQVGQDLTTGKIVALHVSVGDTVKKGDIVAEVESEKASFEVEAFEEGTVLDILYKVDDEAPVLEPLMFLGKAGETVDAKAVPASAAPDAPDEANVTPITSEGKPAPQEANAENDGIVRSSPLARRLAAQNRLNLGEINGTGPKGSVVKRDIEAALNGQAIQTRATITSPVSATGPLSGPSDYPGLRSLQPGMGDPVLFLHGFGAELAAWRPLVMDIHAHNPLLALDLPAHGGAAGAAIKSFDDLVDTIANTIDAAGAGRLHLVGHSLGAAIATSLAGRGAFDVRSLTLIAPAGLGPQVNGDFLDGFLEADSHDALQAWMALLVHQPASLPAAMVRATLAARDGTGLAAAQANFRNAVFARNTQLFSVREDLARFNGPARAIVGLRDRIIPAAHADDLPAHVALHRIPDTGHLPQLEAQGLVARLVSETIRSASLA